MFRISKLGAIKREGTPSILLSHTLPLSSPNSHTRAKHIQQLYTDPRQQTDYYRMRVAVIGGGIRGLVSAYVLAKAGVNVVVYEKGKQFGGHARTVNFHAIDLDLAFMFLNPAKHPNVLNFFTGLGVDVETSDVSFSVSLDNGQGYEWGNQKGFSSLFAQKKNVFNPYFWQMLRDIIRFKDDVVSYLQELENNPDTGRNETMGQFIESRGYSELFRKAYLVPICCSVWSCSAEEVMSFSAFSTLSFCHTHYLYEILGRQQWLTVRGFSKLENKVKDLLESRGCQLSIGCEVHSVLTADDGRTIVCSGDDFQEVYDGCMMAVDAPTALRLLGNQATFDESRILGAFRYAYSDIFLHHDDNLMPNNRAAWSSLNFLRSAGNKGCLTYWLNMLQNVGKTTLPFLLTLNPDSTPKHTLLKWSTSRLIPSVAASKASLELEEIQGKRGIWFCGYDFHGDAVEAGLIATYGILGKRNSVLNKPENMAPSLLERGARLFVTRFLRQFISTGCIILLEEGGGVFTFKGNMNKCSLKTVLRVHSPQFYWKVMTEADLGLADAFMNRDFSFVDKEDGLLHLLMILIANRNFEHSVSRLKKKRGWWTPPLFTAGLAYAKYFFKHVMRQNNLMQARRNISQHYDLSNDFFSLFLDETMTYSCAVFKKEDEDLKVAQKRKISVLIEKAKINSTHEILEIGFGWGSLAIEVVKLTGCRYTGITLSEEQLKFSEKKVKEAGLQDHIKFELCDYRKLPSSYKCDRIISCEMIEHVGDEYLEEFFGWCEKVLTEDGLLVLQFSSTSDEGYHDYRHTSDFLKEYIFPGICPPSLGRISSAMAATTRLCVEHVENIGSQYHRTVRFWKNKLLDNKSKIVALGFNEEFIRMWEYYLDYVAAGMNSRTHLNYQVVFSRHGYPAAPGNPDKGFSSALD
ncbi:hypothetical protein SCA6_016024 [Theobroma cacao]